MQKRAPQAVVAQTFTHATPANMAPGDVVCLTADMTVDSTVNGKAIGEIVSIDKPNSKCVVELFGSKIKEMACAAAVPFNSLVKLAAKNSVQVANPAGVAADIPLVLGTALNNNAGAGTVFVLLYS